MWQVLIFLADKTAHYQRANQPEADEMIHRELKHHNIGYFYAEMRPGVSVIYYGVDHHQRRKVVGMAVKVQTETFGVIEAAQVESHGS